MIGLHALIVDLDLDLHVFAKIILCSYSVGPGPDVIILIPCSTQLSMKFIMLINVKMPTIFNIYLHDQCIQHLSV